MSAFQILKELAPTISVGMLTADLMALGKDLALLEQTDVKLLHFDVMDGCFCPMTTIGPPLIKAVKTPLLKDVHLMIEDPLSKIADYVAAGADMITVHYESSPKHIHRVLQALGKMENVNDPARGIVRGLALNPGTTVEAIEPLLDEVDMVMVLGINPGWGGQKLLGSTSGRVSKARKIISDAGKEILVGIDGGITRDNIAEVARIGADIVITGSAVFDGKAPIENARFMLGGLKGA